MTQRMERYPEIHRVAVLALAVVVPMLLSSGVAVAEPKFKKAMVYLERNATDDDIEVRLLATSDTAGFASLRVIGPGGRTVIDFKSPDSKLGIRHLDLESPEPRDDGSVQADFPEGRYRFEGILVGGATLRTEVTLSHVLPPAPILSSPRQGQADFPVKGAKVQWAAVADAVSCEVLLKEKDGAREMRDVLPGSATSFAVPDGFLVPGSEYKASVGAINHGGNRSYSEIQFTAQK